MQSSEGIEVDPFLEQNIKDNWALFDANNEGEVPFETFWKMYCQKIVNRGYEKNENDMTRMKDICKQMVDPHNTGKVTLEGWRNLVLFGYFKLKKANENI